MVLEHAAVSILPTAVEPVNESFLTTAAAGECSANLLSLATQDIDDTGRHARFDCEVAQGKCSGVSFVGLHTTVQPSS